MRRLLVVAWAASFGALLEWAIFQDAVLAFIAGCAWGAAAWALDARRWRW